MSLRFALELCLLAGSFAVALWTSLFRFVVKIKKNEHNLLKDSILLIFNLFMGITLYVFILLYLLVLPIYKA